MVLVKKRENPNTNKSKKENSMMIRPKEILNDPKTEKSCSFLMTNKYFAVNQFAIFFLRLNLLLFDLGIQKYNNNSKRLLNYIIYSNLGQIWQRR
jgi:hypothetical protein